jgi:hypothetical protein
VSSTGPPDDAGCVVVVVVVVVRVGDVVDVLGVVVLGVVVEGFGVVVEVFGVLDVVDVVIVRLDVVEVVGTTVVVLVVGSARVVVATGGVDDDAGVVVVRVGAGVTEPLTRQSRSLSRTSTGATSLVPGVPVTVSCRARPGRRVSRPRTVTVAPSCCHRPGVTRRTDWPPPKVQLRCHPERRLALSTTTDAVNRRAVRDRTTYRTVHGEAAVGAVSRTVSSRSVLR